MTRRVLPLLLTLLCLGVFIVAEQEEGAERSAQKTTSLRPPPGSPQMEKNAFVTKRNQASSERKFHASARPLELDPEIDTASLAAIPIFSEAALDAVAEKIRERLPSEVIEPLNLAQRERLASFLNNRLADESVGERRFTCFDETSSAEMAMAHHEVEQAVSRSVVSTLARQFLGQGKWSNVASNTLNTGAQGAAVTVTWSIVPDGTSTPGLDNSFTGSNFRAWMSELYGGSATGIASEQPWFDLLRSCFEAMEERSGLTFIYEPNDNGSTILNSNQGALGTRGDIRISARTLDGDGDPAERTNTLAFAFAPNHGDVVLDSGDSFFDDRSSNSRRFFNTMTHELGHAIGLAHVCPLSSTKLMEPLITLSFRGPQFDEFYSLQRQYGDEKEISNGDTNNNAATRATPLELDSDGLVTESWLSIDDNSDIDYFSFSAKALDDLIITVDPGSESYLEGPQTDSCDTETTFTASSQQDLTIELLDQNGTTVLATAQSAAIGEIETLTDFQFSADGTYFFRINGGSANSSQIYSLGLSVSGSPPLPDLNLASQMIVAESGVVKNSRIDERETIQMSMQVSNTGEIATENLIATFAPTPGVTFFTPELTFAEIPVGESRSVDLLFAVTNQCGTNLTITANFTDDSGYEQALIISEPVGINTSTEFLNEGFESTTLPTGWTTTTTGAGIDWLTSTNDSATGSRSAFAENISAISSSTLTSPSLLLGDLDSTLRFFHHYNHEDRWDGSVLEASLDGGAWFDLPENSAVTVISGGYSDTMRGNTQSGLAGRRAWTGNSEGFIESAFLLPTSWAGQEIRFRWLLAHDFSVSLDGWFVDDIALTTESGTCEPHRPELQLTASTNELTEGENSTTLQLTSALPLLDLITLSLTLSGNGDATDLSNLTPLTLPAGQTSVTLTLSAISDSSTEGPETLTLAIPSDAENFAPRAGPGTNTSVTLTILEPSGYLAWSSGFFPTPQPPESDPDGDGWSNLAEYLLDFDPSDSSARPELSPSVNGDLITLPLGPLPHRSDATLGLETSPDLQNWSATPFTLTATGIELPQVAQKHFLRLTFSLNP